MKIVINGDFGGFGLGVDKKYRDLVDYFEWQSMDERANPKLVDFVENHPDECGDLVIVTIPDDATDWDINEHDGYESVIYVKDGKIWYAGADD